MQIKQDNLIVVFIRHGKTVYNVEKRLQGPKDRLNDEGKKQIANLVNSLRDFNFDHFISSDERRSIESAEIISGGINKNFIQTELIREKGSGDFSDKLVSEVDWSFVKGDFLNKKIPNGENIIDVIGRACEFLKTLNSFKQGEKALVVSHGTFLRVLYCIIFNKSIKDYLINYKYPNAGIIILKRNPEGRWSVEEESLRRKE